MAKRKMPPHIVLPNGQWRFVKRGSKATSLHAKKRGVRMTRRKYYGRARRAYRRGGGAMGLIKPAVGGVLGSVVTPYVPVLNTMPYSNVLGGAAGGYIAKRSIGGALIGAASAFLAGSLMGKSGGSYGGGY